MEEGPPIDPYNCGPKASNQEFTVSQVSELNTREETEIRNGAFSKIFSLSTWPHGEPLFSSSAILALLTFSRRSSGLTPKPS